MERKDYVYLAGPMEDLSEEEMKGWRMELREGLLTGWHQDPIQVLDPTRRVTFHDQLGDYLQDTTRSMNVCKRIFKQDMQDIANSRVVVADIRRKMGKGTGTACEIMFAHMKNKIIILYSDPDDPIHPFLESMATEKHYELQDIIKAVRSYY
jgi:nucleoside 2-deoxyribosyltransferase